MIAGISKAIALYLAPLLALTATILSLFAFLAPTLLLHDRVALLTVAPSTVLVQPGPGQSVDGPSVFLGPLGACLLGRLGTGNKPGYVAGSCARSSNDAPLNCTLPSVSPQFSECSSEFDQVRTLNAYIILQISRLFLRMPRRRCCMLPRHRHQCLFRLHLHWMLLSLLHLLSSPCAIRWERLALRSRLLCFRAFPQESASWDL